MTEVTKYIADDGTEFDDEYDCLEYEFEQNVKDGEWTLLDNKLKVLHNDQRRSYEDCWYIFLPTRKSAEALMNAWDEDMIGCYTPRFLREYDFNPGLWAWDEGEDDWYHVGDRISKYQALADQVMAEINKF